MKELAVLGKEQIKNMIYTIRGLQVMLDADLARLYGVSTKRLNQAVKRNIERFPENFMFKLSKEEYEGLVSQSVIPNNDSLRAQNVTLKSKQNLKSQFVTSRYDYGGRRKLPYTFTEQGVAMLSGILKSDTAVKVSIQIMGTFVIMRRFISKNAELFMRLDNVERKQIEYQVKTDSKFNKIFNAIESKQIKIKQGIFFNGQIFDAYSFVSDLIRNANDSIILIDNYIDDSVLILFSKRKKDVSVMI